MGYYAVVIFLAAFLLFQVQPLIGKVILPWFGGAPSVWATSLLFFQLLLVGGYAYAHWLTARLSVRKQAGVHLALLGLSLGLLLLTGLAWASPITPDFKCVPWGQSPVWQTLYVLAISVGLPYFILSTSNPLMQAWFSRSSPSRSPYRLYTLSNAGSLLGVASYPFLVEPVLALRPQARLWTACYVLFALGAGYGALRLWRSNTNAHERTRAPTVLEAHPGWKRCLLWVGLSACASVMLLASTNHISHELLAAPFLWVLLLVLYLVSFMACFSPWRCYSRTAYLVVLFASSALFCWMFYYRPLNVDVWAYIGVYGLSLFAVCMVCHGELAALAPPADHLTTFYVLVSIGGALGGVGVNLVAPHLFPGFWEFPLGLLGCWLLLLLLYARDWRSDRGRRSRWLTDALLMGGIAMLGVTLLLYIASGSANTLHVSRSFYGVLRVQQVNRDDPAQQAYKLVHGTTLHGAQYTAAEKRRLPTTYYVEESGVGLAILHHPRRAAGLRLGVIGLGVGTLAAYGQVGDLFRFYEINPEVIRLAQGEGAYFSYLVDCPAQVELVPGDARLSLERELTVGDGQRFDVLVVDAFSDSSIPLHLLTKEAFDIYLAHLQTDGVIALHISNRRLNLQPVVQRLADHFELHTAFISTPGDEQLRSSSSWVLATRDEGLLAQPHIAERSTPRAAPAASRLWTDDYSNLLQLLEW